MSSRCLRRSRRLRDLAAHVNVHGGADSTLDCTTCSSDVNKDASSEKGRVDVEAQKPKFKPKPIKPTRANQNSDITASGTEIEGKRKATVRSTSTSRRTRKKSKVEEKEEEGVKMEIGTTITSYESETAATNEKSKRGGRKKIKRSENKIPLDCLPRSREVELMQEFKEQLEQERPSRKSTDKSTLHVIGVDEAGRGPLAGPVVAAAAIIPIDIAGIMDSKQHTKEDVREELYEKITSCPHARWAVVISSSKRIDEINILQATLEAMRNAVQSVISIPSLDEVGLENGGGMGMGVRMRMRREGKASSKHDGCYVVCGRNDENGKPMDLDLELDLNNNADTNTDSDSDSKVDSYHALIDGNKVPKDMPCDAECMVKGDSREYSIAAASILAKVTRDRLMHEYDILYPEYNLSQHKGYPTAAHMATVRELGATIIHRRSFAPLKHMELDDDGKVISS